MERITGRAGNTEISSRKRVSGQSESSRQAGPVSQNQICQSKHHIQFGGLLLQTVVSCLPVSESALNYHENMLDFCSNRGLLPFTTLHLSLGTSGQNSLINSAAVLPPVADLPFFISCLLILLFMV